MLASRLAAMYEAPANPSASPADISAIIMSGEYDKVFPMDIMPEFLIKAMIAKNIDKMENLGAYEVAPEDFALCEFVDTSKLPLQAIVRYSLDMLKKEVE